MIPDTVRRPLRLALAALVLHALLILPNHPGAMTWGALLAFPLELPVLLLALVAVGHGAISRVLRTVIVAVLIMIAAQKIADFGMFTALSRSFNPVADLPLVVAGGRLLAGTIGTLPAILATCGALIAIAALVWTVWWATGVWADLLAHDRTGLASSAPRLRSLAAAGTLAFAGVAAADIGNTMRYWTLPADPPGTALTTRIGIERFNAARTSLGDLANFRKSASVDPYAKADGLLDLIDRDVVIVFVESYGRASLDTPLYADLHRATLAAGETRLAGLGLSMASGYLASPTKGGQSWLAHATFANGLWVDGQSLYGAALGSGRQTLFHLAARSGFHTAAVMPQITLPWPEADTMGFNTVLAARDLGYKGLPFNWVTMPDQFTFSAMDRLLRTGSKGGQHLFVQIATGTSHAPWVPVPQLIDWDTIGDGAIFNAMASAGDPPNVVWRDRDRVRAQYRLAVDYALRTVLAYAERQASEPPLMIVMGDHQAAAFVALDERPDVPIHVIGPAHLVDRSKVWGLAPGLIPSSDAPVRPMDQMRDLFLQTYSSADIAQAGN